MPKAPALDLDLATQRCRLLGDATRLRLLLLVDQEELSVAELSAITQLAQPRVSTHLSRLKEAGMVTDRREDAPRAAAASIGRKIVAQKPSPGRERCSTRPPWRATTWCTIARPRPVPLPGAFVV
jgi:DNA-binding transcriptional ArsR family regulator